MKFNNRENEKIQHDGKTLWLSRACAVVGTVVLIKDNIPYVLINKRGKGAADFHGKWNLPCGYLDWDETSGQACLREIWEECGVDVSTLKAKEVRNYFNTAWDTNSFPNENRQNVTLHHGIVAFVDELPSTSLENNEPDEVEDIRWIELSRYRNYDFCFNHTERIEKFIKHTKLDLFMNNALYKLYTNILYRFFK